MRNLWVRIGLVLLVAGLAPWASLRAQNFPGPLMNMTGGGHLPLPPPPPEGAWGEVIFSNPKWLVVQNEEGQQFPIAYNSVRRFLIRWPMGVNDLTNQSVVEAIGPDLGSNVLQTDHIDVYEGTDQALVAPTYNSILPGNRGLTVIDPAYNRYLNAWDMAAQAALYGWAYPVTPTAGNPAALHVVGNVVGLNPLTLSILGNNFAHVIPAPGGVLTITQVTLGSPGFVQKGDIAFLMPIEVTPKTLVLSQLVIYKKITRRQYVP